jgi:hypothetical protein
MMMIMIIIIIIIIIIMMICPAPTALTSHFEKKRITLIIELMSACQIQAMCKISKSEKMRKCEEFSTEVKKVVSRSGVYLTCHYICNRNLSSHIARCPQATRL